MDFLKATIEQLVSYHIAKEEGETEDQLNERINLACKNPKLIEEAKSMVKKWNEERKRLGLKIWT